MLAQFVTLQFYQMFIAYTSAQFSMHDGLVQLFLEILYEYLFPFLVQ